MSRFRFNVLSVNGWQFLRRDLRTCLDHYTNTLTGEKAEQVFSRGKLIGYNVRTADGKHLRFSRELV